MSKHKTPKTQKRLGGQPVVPSLVALDSKLNRAAGVHADQRRKADPKALRRDKSFRERTDW